MPLLPDSSKRRIETAIVVVDTPAMDALPRRLPTWADRTVRRVIRPAEPGPR